MRTLSLLLVAACLATTPAAAQARRAKAETGPVAPAASEKAFPFDTQWNLATLNGKPVGGDGPSFTLDDKLRARGFGGCNSFSMALYPVKNQKLAAGPVAMTRKTCDAGTMAAERAFLVGLHTSPKWDVTLDGVLTLTATTGTMVFRRGI